MPAHDVPQARADLVHADVERKAVHAGPLENGLTRDRVAVERPDRRCRCREQGDGESDTANDAGRAGLLCPHKILRKWFGLQFREVWINVPAAA